MKTVTIGFSHANSAFSRLIMWATRSKVSHTYVRCPSNLVYQASGLRVNEESYDTFLSYETVIKEIDIEITDEQFERGEKFRKQSLGKPYSLREILGFSWVLLMRGIGIKVPNPFKDGDQAYVCVSLVCEYLGLDDSGENITPDDLYQLLVNNKPV
jgi:hypothetical protein